MKNIIKVCTLFMAILASFMFVACGEKEGTAPTPPSQNNNDKEEVQLLDITGVTFKDKSFDFSGEEKEILVDGDLPKGVSVTYTNNKGTNAGTYNAKATLKGEGYKTLELNAKLIINKINFEGLSFKDESFNYDGQEKSIFVIGTLPAGTKVKYNCEDNENITNTAIETGSYTIVATITNPNFNTLTLKAVISIKGEEKERHIIAKNNMLYFANALDNDYLYSYILGNKDSLKRVSFDIPYNFTFLSDDVFFRSKSLFGGAIKNILSDNSVKSRATEKGEYLCSDNNNLYFVKNGLTNNGSGIYKLILNGDNEPTVQLLSKGKAKYLQCYNGKLYFADGTNKGMLSSISTSGVNQTRKLISEDKITCLLAQDGYLYFNSKELLGSCIKNYKIADGKITKLSSDAGANLTVVGDKLYYINIDLLSSYVNGDGIYYVNARPASNKNTSGSKLLSGDTFSSLTKISSSKIAYYRVSDQMLCVKDIIANNTTEVLKDFKAPETTPLSTGSKVKTYKDTIYYLDLYRDKCLYSYNPDSKQFAKITSNKVSDFNIIGDYLYYNMVTILVNNDLYRINLKTGGEPECISKNDCNDIVMSGDKIFYVEQNAAGVRTALHEINNGKDTIIYDKGIEFLTCYKDNLYFVDGDTLYTMPTSGYTINTPKVLRKKDVSYFIIHDDVIYFREVFMVNKQLSKMNLDGTGYAKVIDKCDPTDIIVYNNEIYYYSDTAKEEIAGFYKVGLNGENPTKISPRTVNGKAYYGTEMVALNNNIYFINYVLGGTISDSHLYKIDLKTKKIDLVK